MARMIACAAVLVALVGTCFAAEDYAPAPEPQPAPKAPEGPVFTEMKLQNGAGQPSNGLQLTLKADNLVLREIPGAPGQPLIVEPVVLRLLFRNASDHSLVLDTYNLSLSRLSLVVVGPDKETVAITHRKLNITTRAALPIDYPQVEPGNPLVPMAGVAPIQFPGDFNPLVNCALFTPGDYKVQVIYSRAVEGGPAAWQGTVVSNTLTFRIVALRRGPDWQ